MATKLKTGNIAADQLESLLQRIERLEEEKKALADDIKEVYAEAKAHGYNTKIMRQIVKLRAMDAAERAEQEALLDTYKHALGMLSDTPLGEAAVQQMKDAEPARRMARAAGRAEVELAKAAKRFMGTLAGGGSVEITTGTVTTKIVADDDGGVASFERIDNTTGEVLDDEDDEPAATTKAEPAEMHAGTDYDFPDCLKRC